MGTATCVPSSSNSFCASASARASSLSRRRIRPSLESWAPMPESSESSKFSSRPEERPMADTARNRRLSSGEGVSVSGVQGRFRKMAARLTLRISRRNSRNCFNIASASSEWVRMDEKSRSTSSVCAALMERSAAGDSAGRENKREDGMGAGGGVCRGCGMAGAFHRRSSNEFKSRRRTGLVSTWVTPCKKASSSHSDWLSAV